MICSSSSDLFQPSATDRLRSIITHASRAATQEEEEQAAEPLSMEYLITECSPKKMRHGKAQKILCSLSALVSVMSSCILIWMIRRSHFRFSTPYHRLLLCLCIGDMIFSFSNSLFNVWMPRELDYFQ